LNDDDERHDDSDYLTAGHQSGFEYFLSHFWSSKEPTIVFNDRVLIPQILRTPWEHNQFPM